MSTPQREIPFVYLLWLLIDRWHWHWQPDTYDITKTFGSSLDFTVHYVRQSNEPYRP